VTNAIYKLSNSVLTLWVAWLPEVGVSRDYLSLIRYKYS